MRRLGSFLIALAWGLQATVLAGDVASDFQRPRVPPQALAMARSWQNPLPDTPEVVEQGRRLYYGKGFCVACHGREGRGMTDVDPTLVKGTLPTDFTQAEWQAARTDGELLWILQHGSAGTAMASFIPAVLTEEEAWQVIWFVRSLRRP
jgi:mono/diheme cytochrome c family protein